MAGQKDAKKGAVDAARSGPVKIPVYWEADRQTYCARYVQDGIRKRIRNKDLKTLKANALKVAKLKF